MRKIRGEIRSAHDWYDMECGERRILRDREQSIGAVVRVPGGWVIETFSESAVFVPFNNEFQKVES